jgi:HK97 family phage prohead protease
MKTIEYKAAKTEIKDVDKKGVVIFYASIFGNKDYGGDIVERGAFAKTIRENFTNIRHYKHHKSEIMPGVLHDLVEDHKGLLATSHLIMDNQAGRETYNEYKAMIEAGKSMDHSIGYWVVKEEKINEHDPDKYERRLKELNLMEVSTLTAWGMNPEAHTVDVKHMMSLGLDELLKEEIYFKQLLNCEFTDVKLEQLEILHKNIQALIADRAGSSTRDGEPPNGQGAGTSTLKAKDYINKLTIKI